MVEQVHFLKFSNLPLCTSAYKKDPNTESNRKSNPWGFHAQSSKEANRCYYTCYKKIYYSSHDCQIIVLKVLHGI